MISSFKYLFPILLQLSDIDTVTLPRSDLTGDMISWEKEPWSLTSPLQSSELELLDYERDVCQRPDVRRRNQGEA